MRLGDAVWGAALLVCLALLGLPATHVPIVEATKLHPFAMGFVKFAILATMGELLSIRIVTGAWTMPAGLPWRAVVWGHARAHQLCHCGLEPGADLGTVRENASHGRQHASFGGQPGVGGGLGHHPVQGEAE
jgi:hypothetical protein